MDDADLQRLMAERKAAVVHFSHHVVMRAGVSYPADLRDAIANRDRWRLSCCLVWPGHTMDLPGSVGVIFTPSANNVVSVSPTDSGSMTLPDGSEGSLGLPLTADHFDACFRPLPPKYNEWRVQGAGVRGIYVENPSAIYVKKMATLHAGGEQWEESVMTQISLDEVFTAFPGWPIFTMGPDGLIELARPRP